MDDMILIHNDKEYLKNCLLEIKRICKDELALELNSKTQIGKVMNGIDFLGFRHILTHSGKIIVKMRQSSKIRMKRHLKTVNKLRQKELVNDKYVFFRMNAYYNHIRRSNENMYFKSKVKPK